MYVRSSLGSTVVLSLDLEIVTIPPIFKGAKLVVINQHDVPEKFYEKIIIQSSEKVRLYFDDCELLISDFDEVLSVVDVPIDAIVIRKHDVNIYVNGKLLVFKENQFHDYALKESFFTRTEDAEPVTKKSRNSIEPQRTLSEDVFNDDYSEEIGESYDTDIYGGEATFEKESEDHHTCEAAPITTTAANSMKRISKTRLDQKLAKQLQMSECARKVKEVFEGVQIETLNQSLSVNQFRGIDWPEEDEELQTLIDVVKEDLALPDTDPITVVKRNGLYSVLSGSKRVQACQSQRIGKINVQTVQSADALKFSVRKYFRENEAKEVIIVQAMKAVNELMECTNMTIQEVGLWKDVDLIRIFGKYIDFDLKIGRIFKICLHRELAEKVKDICQGGVDFSSRCLLDILTKYKVNPLDTIKFLCKSSWSGFNEKVLRAEIKTIEPDLSTLIGKKITDNTVAQQLVQNFSDNHQFLKFLRSADLRKRGLTNYYDYIANRFDQYKSKTQNRNEVTTVSVSKANEDTGFFLSTNTNAVRSWLESTDESEKTRVGIVMGEYVDGSSVHSITFPDEMCFKDEFSMVVNRLSVSVLVKRQQMLQKNEYFAFFEEKGMSYREAYNMRDFKKLFSQNSICYADLNCPLQSGLIIGLVKDVNHIQVENQSFKDELIRKITNHSRRSGNE